MISGQRSNNVLIIGMSGTGKSTVLRALAAKGYETVDIDSGEWCEWIEMSQPGGVIEHDWICRPVQMMWLLTLDRPSPLFVSGCKSNQGSFHAFFDRVILISARTDVLLARIASRTSNDYGKRADERDEILGYLETI